MNQGDYIAEWRERNAARADLELQLGGASLLVRKEVSCPDPLHTNATAFMLRFLPDVTGRSVLDIGTGCGVLAVIAAMQGARNVVAVDIDRAAVNNTLENCGGAGVLDRVTVHQGDLFGPVTGKFDIVTAVLPILDSAWRPKGIRLEDIYTRFFQGLAEHLSAEGTALFCFASFGNREMLENAFRVSPHEWMVQEESRFGVLWYLFTTGTDNHCGDRIEPSPKK